MTSAGYDLQLGSPQKSVGKLWIPTHIPATSHMELGYIICPYMPYMMIIHLIGMPCRFAMAPWGFLDRRVEVAEVHQSQSLRDRSGNWNGWKGIQWGHLFMWLNHVESP